MKSLFRIFIILSFIGFSFSGKSQMCSNDSTGQIPIPDFGAGTYHNIEGGLYYGGSNTMPAAHRQAGVFMANNIEPLDASGNPDPSGKIGILSVGMSNTRSFFIGFTNESQSYPDLNPDLVFVNGAQGGKDIDAILQPNTDYWTNSDARIAADGLTIPQIQVVWFLQATHISNIPPGQGIEHIDTLSRKFLDAFKIIKQRYPNVKQIYCPGRSYGGYHQPNSGSPEPYAYWTNWSFKQLLLRQMNGDPALSYFGGNAQIPWLAWSNNLWADGTNLRGDGHHWLCSDYQSDGVHPSPAGRAKGGQLMVDFFSTDVTSPWYRTTPPSGANCSNDSTGQIPMPDFGPGSFHNIEGGLYYAGSNTMPAAHQQAGIALDNSIEPLDASGNPDVSGKIGILSVGMSNTRDFFSGFINESQNYPNLNPDLVFVNGAQGGKDIDAILRPTTDYWDVSDTQVTASGLTNPQVQVVWFLQATHISNIPPGEGIEHIDTLSRKFLDAFKIIKQRYPNVKQIYCPGRSYGGYHQPNSGSPEPYAYWTNWSFKQLLLRQMNGDPALAYSGANPQIPWLAWANNLWADGTNLRTDGHHWLCSDYQTDGVHPSAAGRAKGGQLMVDFFSTDTTSTWYRGSQQNNCTTLDIKVYLEGALSTGGSIMHNKLYQQGVLPDGQPYDTPPWNYFGTEGDGWTISDYPVSAVDWVLVSLRTGFAPSTEVYQTAGVLLSDGTIYFPNNCHPQTLLNYPSLGIIIEHRVHMGILSPTKKFWANRTLQHDFTLNDSYKNTTSSGQKFVQGAWVMYAGDMDQSDMPGYDITGLDKVVWQTYNGMSGDYNSGDVNMDADNTGADRILWQGNSGIFSIVRK